jgi:hypothetical protein
MERKVCSKCKEEKEICEFQKDNQKTDGYRYDCKSCRKKFRKSTYYIFIDENREKNRERQKKYYQNNTDKERIRCKTYREILTKDKSIVTPKTKEEIKLKKQEWIKNNRELNNQKKRNKYKNNINHRISINVRNRMNNFLKSKNIQKRNKTFEVIGCSPDFLKEHIENQFIDGMSWNNRNEWHIDHIIPLSSAKTEEELYSLCHYTNLQPLWVEDNLKKSNKIL